jgi:hypothetical protein
MQDESAPNKPLPGADSAWVTGASLLVKYAGPWPIPFYLAGRIRFLYARSRRQPSKAIPPHIERALAHFTAEGWNLTTAQRLAQLTYRHTSKRFLADYSLGPNNRPGISRPTLDESREGTMPPVWGERRSARLGP